MIPKNIMLILIIFSITLASGCSDISDIPNDLLGKGYSQMAGLDINDVEFLDANIIESNEIIKFSIRFNMDIENKVKVESSAIGHPSRILEGRTCNILINSNSYNNQAERLKINLIGEKEILPNYFSGFTVINEFYLPKETIEKSGEIKFANYFTQQANGDPNIKQMEKAILTTIEFSKNTRTKEYEIIAGNSEIVQMNNQLIQINWENL